MPTVGSINEDAEQIIVEFDKVVWGKPETVIINKSSQTIKIVYKRRERGGNKVEGCNFDDISSFHVDLVGREYNYSTITLETRYGRSFRLVPVGGTRFTLLKEGVVRDLYTRLNAYLPETRALPIPSNRLVSYMESSDGSHVARIKQAGNKTTIGLFITFMGIAIGLLLVTFSSILTMKSDDSELVLGTQIIRAFFIVISISLFLLSISITEEKMVQIDPGTKQVITVRGWLWFIRVPRKPVPFSDISGFESFLIGQKCYVRLLRLGSLQPVNLFVTSQDSAEARGLVDWLREHVPSSGSRTANQKSQ